MCQSSLVREADRPQYQDTAQRDSTFVMTLPFDQNLVKRYITDAVLSRTKRRWEWFANAQRLNPGLGTLRYLPAEVRRMIWKDLFQCRDTLSSDGLWEYDCTCGPIFDLSAYYFGFGRRGLANYNGLKGLRFVSSNVKAESDDVFLTYRTFRFNQAQNLDSFLKQLTPVLSDRIRSIEIGICTLCKYLFRDFLFDSTVSFLQSLETETIDHPKNNMINTPNAILVRRIEMGSLIAHCLQQA